MMAHGIGSTGRIDLSGKTVTGLQHALMQSANMGMKSSGETACIADLENAALPFKPAGITHLATGLGIERRSIQDQRGLDARLQPVDWLALHNNGEQPAFIKGIGCIAKKLCYRQRRDQIGRQAVCTGKPASRAGPLALLLHRPLKTLLVNIQVAFTSNIAGEVKRKTV